MPRELRPIDVSNQPELRRIAEEVYISQQPRVLRRGAEDLAILRPVRAPRKTTARARTGTRGKRLTPNDSLFNIIGMATAEEGEPTDVSANKHKYLADAYASHTK
jgi:hypothetical protein